MGSRVLVVEDEPCIAMDLAELAVTLGFEVAGPAVSSQSALMVAADQPPDIAIVDVNLTDGPTGAFVAAQLATKFGTEVLMITANPELVQQGVGGIAAVIAKPYDPSDVSYVLAALAARRETAPSTVRN